MATLFIFLSLLAGCGAAGTQGGGDQPAAQNNSGNQAAAQNTTAGEDTAETVLRMKIGDNVANVEWEDNESVEELKALCRNEALTVKMSMYGGFEQVGSIGQALPREDRQTTTQPGDIVLYSGNQIVVFYGSNTWAYTRLGHITDKSAQELAQLLGNGDVTITIEAGR